MMKFFYKKAHEIFIGLAPHRRHKPSGAGFVMLFSAVISSILLAIALGVANIAVKELAFDTSAKRTNDAFFAADTAVECALYHDLASGDESAFGVPSTDLNTACVGTDVDLNNEDPVPTTGPWDFVLFPLSPSGNACAKVTVTKTFSPDPESTVIVARGYNLGGNTYDCSSSSQNRVERELQVTIGEPPGPPVFYDLDVAVSGPANSGSVTSDVGSINCPGACNASYLANTLVTLTAIAQPGYALTGWSDPACPGTGACAITMSSDKSITATFELITSSYPTIAGVVSSFVNSNSWSHTVSLPSGIQPGDLLLVFFSGDGIPDLSLWPSGWTQLMEASTPPAYETLAVYYKIADGTEGTGFTFTIGGSNPEQSAHRAFRITGYSGVPYLNYAISPSASDNPDSPSLTIPGAVKKTLWISAIGRENGTSTTDAYPAGYSNGVTSQTNTGNFGSAMSTATNNIEASTEDPGSHTLSANDLWIAATVGIQGQ